MSELQPVVDRARAIEQVVKDLEAKPEGVQLVDTLYSELKKSIEKYLSEGGVSAANIIIIIDTAMKLAAKMKTLTGPEKKAVVIAVILRLVDEADLKPEDEAVIKIIAERALDPAIDQLFAMAPEVYGKVKTTCLTLCKK